MDRRAQHCRQAAQRELLQASPERSRRRTTRREGLANTGCTPRCWCWVIQSWRKWTAEASMSVTGDRSMMMNSRRLPRASRAFSRRSSYFLQAGTEWADKWPGRRLSVCEPSAAAAAKGRGRYTTSYSSTRPWGQQAGRHLSVCEPSAAAAARGRGRYTASYSSTRPWGQQAVQRGESSQADSAGSVSRGTHRRASRRGVTLAK